MRRAPALVAAAALAVAVWAGGATAQTLGSSVFGNGGADLSGSGNTLRGTLGQVFIGRSTGPGSPANFVCSGYWCVEPALLVAVGDRPGEPAERLEFRDPAPNPSTAGVDLRFGLTQPAEVELTLFAITGARVRTLASSRMEPGLHALHWDGADARGRTLGAGIYFAVLRVAGKEIGRKRIALLH